MTDPKTAAGYPVPFAGDAEPVAYDAETYAVGYGKPPSETRFKPGQSGNPRGRPKRAQGLAADLRAELDERVSVTIDGRKKLMPKRRLIIKMLAAKAAKGDLKAADQLLGMVIQAEGFEDRRPAATTLCATDHLILKHILTGNGSGRENVTVSVDVQCAGDNEEVRP